MQEKDNAPSLKNNKKEAKSKNATIWQSMLVKIQMERSDFGIYQLFNERSARPDSDSLRVTTR